MSTAAPVASNAGVPGPDTPSVSAGVTELGLPRRVRQASLAPQLRTGPAYGQGVAEQQPADNRSPEETRALMSSLQRGWERGRSMPPPPAPQTRPHARGGFGHPASSEYGDANRAAPGDGKNGGR
jgi:hypothetical protein